MRRGGWEKCQWFYTLDGLTSSTVFDRRVGARAEVLLEAKLICQQRLQRVIWFDGMCRRVYSCESDLRTEGVDLDARGRQANLAAFNYRQLIRHTNSRLFTRAGKAGPPAWTCLSTHGHLSSAAADVHDKHIGRWRRSRLRVARLAGLADVLISASI